MAKQLVDTKYADMSDKYKRRVNKKEYNARKESQRMAGEALENGQTAEQYQQDSFKVDNLEDFDARRAGKGSALGSKNAPEGQMGRGRNRLSKSDARGLMEQGFSAEEIQKHASGQEGKDDFIFGKSAQKFLQRKIAEVQSDGPDEPVYTRPILTPTPAPAPTPTPTPAPTPTPEATNPTPSPGTGINAPVSGSTGNVESTHDASIVGNNNNLIQETTIDNSSRVYGGSNRIFNYTGGSNPATDTPVSAATMGGFYDVDDSASANASRLDRQIGQNKDAQKYWQQNASSIAADAIKMASANTSINPDAIDERLVKSEQDSFDRATQMGANIFGDMAAYGGAPTFKPAKPPKPVEQPDFQGFYDNVTSGF